MDKTSEVTTPACVFEIGRECIICGGTVKILTVVDPRTICPDCVAKIRKVIGVDNEMLPSGKLFGNSEQLESSHEKDHVADPGNMVGDLISRQANCDYCHEDSDGYVRPIEKNAHAVLFMGVLRIKGYGHKWDVKINYCPMCGRELRHG